MHPLINIAVKAARNASKIILRATDRLDTIRIEEKKTANDFVTDIDQQAEFEIIKTIRESYPDHAIIAEESGTSGCSDYTWIIDPIDGTSNFLHGHPHFSISIGIKCKDRMEHGLIYDPLRQELFTASAGGGAFLNDHRIRVNQRKQFTGALIASNFGAKTNKNFELYLKILATLIPQVAGIRGSGSAALDCAYTACGRLDGFFQMNLAEWDIAAGSLILQEAGAIVTDFAGENGYLEDGSIIAGNPNISKQLLELIQGKM